MAGEDNTFLKLEFSVSDEFGKMVETTDEEEAKKAGIHNPKARYGSSIAIMSDPRLVKGFKDALAAAKDGVATTASIKKGDAFGERREELVVLLPMKKFEEANLHPQVGMVIDLDGSQGRVQSISGGRVRVDMNHELAGKDIIYKFKILERISEPEKKINAIIEEQLGLLSAAKVIGELATISIPQDAMGKDEYLHGKYGAIQAALQFIPEIKKIEWTEEFVRSA
ncbi:MAG: hypothetical protein V1835_01385 [Candidatus Micrarchaeota archaeon]